jgi:hypothetical protein
MICANGFCPSVFTWSARKRRVGCLTAFGGRFRYSDLKEALTAASTMGLR